jgi:hypothetical protein
MTSDKWIGAIAVACAVGAGCGNYSNEDLEFMAAVPTTTELAVELPAAVNTTTEAELAKKTHDSIATVNGALRSVLGLVDGIRAYTPSSRTDDSRTWGPFPDQQHPGWSWELIVSRDPQTPTTFTYELQVQDAGAGIPWLVFVSGSFDGAGGARLGSGRVAADFQSLADAGFALDAGAKNLADLSIAYQNFDLDGSPTEVTMTMDSTPDPVTGAVTTLSIVYAILADRSGEMAFTLTGNLIPGPATEVLEVNSQWLSSGAGEGTMRVASGDGAGLQQTECWDSSFAPTFNLKPWSTEENVGTAGDCPALPALPPLSP